MITALALMCSFLTSAASASTVVPAATIAPATAPIAAPSVALLKDRFTEAVEAEEKNQVLTLIAKTPPTSGQDVAGLFDLFSRFPENAVRQAVMDSLAKIPGDSPQLEPLFLTYLKQPEPESQLFGINGAFFLRIRAALPMIRAIAGRKISAASASETTMMSERNAWWAQYEALSVLAQWEGEKALPLLQAKSRDIPLIGRILGRYFWKQTFPQLKTWAQQPGSLSHERAMQTVGVPIEPADARATREGMIALLKDHKADPELRHQLALKVGLSSTDEEIEALIGEHDAEKKPQERLYWASAIFVSRSPKAVPLLLRYARQADDNTMRQGATAQLADMFGKDEAAKMIEDDKKK
jgi:hypothetical protein